MTGPLLSVGSRLQTYWSSRFFQKLEPIPKSKKGAVVLVGGGDGSMTAAYSTACTLLHHMHVVDIYPLVYSHATNAVPAVQDAKALEGINQIVSFFRR